MNGIRTHELCDAGAILCQLSYEATQMGAGQFVKFTFPLKGLIKEKSVWKKCLSFSKIQTLKRTSAQVFETLSQCVPQQSYTRRDDHTSLTYNNIPGFKPISI